MKRYRVSVEFKPAEGFVVSSEELTKSNTFGKSTKDRLSFSDLSWFESRGFDGPRVKVEDLENGIRAYLSPDSYFDFYVLRDKSGNKRIRFEVSDLTTRRFLDDLVVMYKNIEKLFAETFTYDALMCRSCGSDVSIRIGDIKRREVNEYACSCGVIIPLVLDVGGEAPWESRNLGESYGEESEGFLSEYMKRGSDRKTLRTTIDDFMGIYWRKHENLPRWQAIPRIESLMRRDDPRKAILELL